MPGNVIERPVRLTRPVFLVSWELAGLGALPAVVDPDQTYRTGEATAALRERALGVLARLGLADADGLLAPRYRATLAVLAAARREAYAWSNCHYAGEHESGASLTADSGRDAIRLITDHEVIQLDPIRPAKVIESLVDALPTYPAARIRSLSVPKAHYDDAGHDFGADDPLAELSDQADELRLLMRAERAAIHQLYIAIRARTGERARSAPLSAIDLVGRGRVLSFVTDGPDGAPQVTLRPGHRARLAAALVAASGALE
ncbi:ESX secretion-associated protein EspG [Amycolatopsis panacis]|uniref:ESX secretion-associated protein EspG n=1 Tax=Amycolatopsis panacis TaxID=2340917 RepID=A0A419HZT3_9PSEU|nr:ESX secretion-associated protein EspG [Amycolatopsis panacis]RJQ82745.1 ESX secretion-associated protein EspG [Amycolatopsis panacis]